MAETLTDTALKAIRWNYGGFLSRSVAGFVVGIVLARLLGPKPFGQIGVAAIVFGLGNQLADAGFSSALVQAPHLQPRQIRFVFTLQVLIGCAMTALAFSIAPAVAFEFRDSGITAVLRTVSPLFLLQSLGQTATGLLKRNMRFQTVQTAMTLSYLFGYGAIGVTMAYAGCGVWSLVAAQLTQALLYSLIAYANVRHSLYPLIDCAGLRLLRFGAQVTGANIINWTISNLDNMVVGRAFGSDSLGLYSRAFNLASNPAEGFISTCQQVLFASCSRTERNVARMRRAYLATVAGVALIVFPGFWSLAACSKFVVVGLYGPRWTPAVALFAYFAIAMPFFALMATAGPVLAAADRVSQEVRTQAASLFLSGILFVSAARISLRAVAIAVVLAYIFRFWCATRPALRLLDLGWRDLYSACAGPLTVAALCTALVFCTARIGVVHVMSPTFGLALSMIVAASTFVAGGVLGRTRVVPVLFLSPLLESHKGAPTWTVRLLRHLALSSPKSIPYSESS